ILVHPGKRTHRSAEGRNCASDSPLTLPTAQRTLPPGPTRPLPMKKLPILSSLGAAALALAAILALPGRAQTPPKPLRALLVAGGCCHDYAGQHKALAAGISARANVRVDVWWTDDKSTDPPLTIYDKDD